MKLVIKGFKQPDFQASDKNLTHLLFMKPWISNFICNEDISAHEKKYIEDLVTPQFFSKFKDSEIVEVEDEDCDDGA
mgnify:CR=1 FL=1|jgi:hypothetical protein